MFDTRAFEGIENLYGKDHFLKIRSSHILVIGIGGVGSWIAESLTRSGVGSISIMDMDEICVSNINRQIHANSKNIGQAKVDAMEKRLLEINPNLKCHKIFDFFSESNQEILLSHQYDFIIDAIDSVKSKATLHNFAKENNLNIICVGGSGSRIDPTQITINDLRNSVNDKLLKQLKRKLRASKNFSKFPERPFNIPTVFSKEVPLDILNKEENKLKDGLVRNCQSGLGSASFVTASFGFAAVSYILNKLNPHENH